MQESRKKSRKLHFLTWQSTLARACSERDRKILQNYQLLELRIFTPFESMNLLCFRLFCCNGKYRQDLISLTTLFLQNRCFVLIRSGCCLTRKALQKSPLRYDQFLYLRVSYNRLQIKTNTKLLSCFDSERVLSDAKSAYKTTA